MDFCSLDFGTHVGEIFNPETTGTWKNRAFSVLFLIRNALVVLCPLLPGASAKVPVGGCSGCGCTGGRMEKWYKKMKLIYKFGAELAKNFETVLRSVFFKICPDFKYLLLLGLHGSLVASSAQVVSMNLILYGSLAMVAFSKPWRAMVCNFLDMSPGLKRALDGIGMCLKNIWSVLVLHLPEIPWIRIGDGNIERQQWYYDNDER